MGTSVEKREKRGMEWDRKYVRNGIKCAGGDTILIDEGNVESEREKRDRDRYRDRDRERERDRDREREREREGKKERARDNDRDQPGGSGEWTVVGGWWLVVDVALRTLSKAQSKRVAHCGGGRDSKREKWGHSVGGLLVS